MCCSWLPESQSPRRMGHGRDQTVAGSCRRTSIIPAPTQCSSRQTNNWQSQRAQEKQLEHTVTSTRPLILSNDNSIQVARFLWARDWHWLALKPIRVALVYTEAHLIDISWHWSPIGWHWFILKPTWVALVYTEPTWVVLVYNEGHLTGIS